MNEKNSKEILIDNQVKDSLIYERNKLNKKENAVKVTYTYIILMYLLVFQDFLSNYIYVFRFLDEILAVIGISMGVLYLFKNNLKIKKDNFIIVMCLCIITIVGFSSIIKYRYQSFIYAMIDWILVIKFFSTYCLSKIVFKNLGRKENNRIIVHIKFMIIVLFLLTIANYVFNLYDGEVRFGIKSNRLFYSIPAILASECFILMVNIILFSKNIKKVWIYIFMLSIILVSTLRIKVIGATLVSLLIIFYLSMSNKKITISRLAIVGLICIIVGYGQISFYFLDINSGARRILLDTSIKIANDYFPIGTGFGTYGSYISGEQYSPIYAKYRINNVFGLVKGKVSFVSDTFWPMILGQFGYIGLISYIVCIIIIFKNIQRNYDSQNKKIYMAQLISLIFLLISSVSDASFVHSISIQFAIILGIHTTKNKEELL